MNAFQQQRVRYPHAQSPLSKRLLSLPLVFAASLLAADSASGNDTPVQVQSPDVSGGLGDNVEGPDNAATDPRQGDAEAAATETISKTEDVGDDVAVYAEGECSYETFASPHVLPLVPLTETSGRDDRPITSSLTEDADVKPEPTKEAKYRVQREKVYFGNPRRFDTPGMLSAAKVYAKIPAYRKILDRRLTKEDPEYWPLMRRASAAFVRGLKSVCSNDGYDLVGEVGSIAPVGKPEPIPDITRAVSAAVRRVSIVRRAAGGEADDEAVLKELVNFPDFGE